MGISSHQREGALVEVRRSLFIRIAPVGPLHDDGVSEQGPVDNVLREFQILSQAQQGSKLTDSLCLQWLWNTSYILESICVLPQLLLLRQTTVPTVIDSYYLLALGLYRGLYIVGWITRAFDTSDTNKAKAVQVIFGLLQTALYIDFAWVYYTRQRVKLRSGGLVDADDMRRSWLLRRIFGKHVDSQLGSEQHDEEGAPALGNGRGQGRSAWGRRGISVSADDGLLGQDGAAFSEEEHGVVDGGDVDPDARMKDPDELALALDDEDEEGAGGSSTLPTGIHDGGEWRD